MIEKQLEDYKNYLIKKNRSKATIEAYLRDITSFVNCFEFKDFHEVTNEHIQTYTDNLKEVKAPKSINRGLVSIAGIAKFLKIHELEVMDYRVKEQEQPFKDDTLSLDQLKRIINQAEKVGDIRAVTLFKALALTGARISEILQIKVEDINNDVIKVKGKGSKYRYLLIPKSLKKQFKLYEAKRLNTTEYLFSGERGPINRQTCHKMIKEYTGKARGIKKDIAHAHAFRHLYALLLKKYGVNEIDIANLLGHKLTTTAYYISSSRKDLLKAISKIDI